MVEIDMNEVLMSNEDDAKEKQNSIVVPIDDDMDKVSSSSPVPLTNWLWNLLHSAVCKKNRNNWK